MRKLLCMLDGVMSKMTTGTAVLGGWMYLLTAFIVAYEVVMRGLFDAPTEWSLEISGYLVLIAGFLGLAMTYADDKHIRVDLITELLPVRCQKVLSVVVGILGLIFAVVFFVESLDMALNSYDLGSKSTSTLRVPLYIPQMALPVGGLLLVWQFLRKILLDVSALQHITGNKQEEQP